MGATSLDLSQIKTDVLSAASTFRTLIGLGNVNNTADLDKPISTATQSALDLKADSSDLSSYLPLAGGTLTGGLGGTDISLTGNITIPSDAWIGISSNGSRFLPRTTSFRLYSSNSLTIESNANDTAINTTLTTRQLYLRNSTNAMRMELYGTFTDASNYRRLYISSTTAGAFTLGVEGLGTGASGNTLTLYPYATVRNTTVSGGYNAFNETLRVENGDNASINIVSATNRASHIYFSDTANAGQVSYSHVNDSFIFYTSATERLRITNNLITFGGTTSSYSAFKPNGTTINFRLADDSADASITSGPIQASTVASTNKGLIVRGSAAQSANLVEVQDVSQNVLASIDKDGDVVANSGSFHTVQLTSDTPRQSGVLFLDNNKLLTTSTNFIHDNSNPASPKLVFKASGDATPDISLNVLTSASGSSSGVQTLSFEGSAGQLFSVSDVLNSGTIFGVNDISGLPLLEVDATGLVSLARFGTGINAHRTVNCLQGVSGTTGTFSGAISATTGTFTGNITGNIIGANSGSYFQLIRSAGAGARFACETDYTWTIKRNDGSPNGLFMNLNDPPNQFLRLGNGAFLAWGDTAGVANYGLALINDANNILAQRNSTNAQTFRLYNAYTDGSNYDRGFMRWNSNILEIGTERAGTYATTRNINLISGSMSMKLEGSSNGWGFYNSGFSILSGGTASASFGNNIGVTINNRLTFVEIATPATPAANNVVIYAKDNGSGKTQLVVLMPDGVETVLVTQT